MQVKVSITFTTMLASMLFAGASACEDENGAAGTESGLGSRQGPGGAAGTAADPAPVPPPEGSAAGVPGPAPAEVGEPVPAATPEEIAMAQRCSDLKDAARAEFLEAAQGLEVDQCETDRDCMQGAFSSDADGCWTDCGGSLEVLGDLGRLYRGGSDYAEAMHVLGSQACAPFHDEGCVHAPGSCGALHLPDAVWTCVDGACVSDGD